MIVAAGAAVTALETCRVRTNGLGLGDAMPVSRDQYPRSELLPRRSDLVGLRRARTAPEPTTGDSGTTSSARRPAAAHPGAAGTCSSDDWPAVHRPWRRPVPAPGCAAPTLLTLGRAVVFVAVGFWLLSFALSANPATAAALRPSTQAAALAQTEGTFRVGILVVVLFVTLFFISIACLDLLFAARRWDSIGLRIQRWAEANLWFAFGLLVILGALVAHVGGNAIHYA